MHSMGDAMALWLKSTALGHAMVTLPWLWPLCETLHFIGLALLIGIIGVFDLRCLGFLRRIPFSAVMDLRPWAAAGLLINLVTGVMFFVGAASQYMYNPAWWWKVAFLVIAGLNIALFETSKGTKLLARDIGPGEDTPMMFKVAGGVSLVSWFFVLYFGRMLPFIGNAF
jgi:uncharacterized protein DUF6644